jgi:hypothetical protein
MYRNPRQAASTSSLCLTNDFSSVRPGRSPLSVAGALILVSLTLGACQAVKQAVDPAPPAGPDFCLEYEKTGEMPEDMARVGLQTPQGIRFIQKNLYNEIQAAKKCPLPGASKTK